MPVPGRFHRSMVGGDEYVRALASNNAAATTAMAALNTGVCFRFTAPDSRDVKSVWINWSAVATPGAFSVRIETIDATTGKPTGTLVHANATATAQTPTAGWQQVTLGATPWASHMAAGTEYAVVILTTTGGTTQTLRSHDPTGTLGGYPTVVLTAADGTTRSNFAEVASAVPICSLVFSDDLEESLAFCPYATLSTSNVFTTNAAGMKFTVPAGMTWQVAGVEISNLTRTGTPAGDLRIRVFNSADAAVSNTTLTLDKDSMTGGSAKRCRVHFPAVVTLAAGTYRVVMDSASSANSSNCWAIKAGQARTSATAPSGFCLTATADVTAGTISWTDTAADVPALALILDDVTGTPPSPLVLGG